MAVSATPEFNSVEHLQACVRRWYNREVRNYFRDLNIDDNWSPNLNVPRENLARACLHLDTDNLATTHLRLELFNEIRGQAHRVPYYGIPVTSFQESRKFQPQIKLFFQEDLEDVDPDYCPIAGEIGFRLMGSASITKAQAATLANRVKLAFGNGGSGYIWRRGKDMATYNDWKKGYALQILTRSKSEARELIGKVLDVQNHNPNWANMNYSENEEPMEAYPTIPDRDTIYGELRRLPRKRPIANVRFQYALLHIHGVAAPIVLYDRSYTYAVALAT
ncbi:hypothetical protein IQ265_00795 [Nodosilinea sp. LEGE 06152]|uniref:hypothetical protein n=1 Tax=Nodosilinea sp. LEGE 06152 TaxID=2777966 RepID=UPI001880E851|nr:hypothetical protein [Nodosilinea sp. LEGE 06152]MBE9155385.1 hypothetical protein [Nodosilinea sp. LEGE 06152]